MLAVAASCAQPRHGGTPSPLKDAVILVIRHAEDAREGDGLSATGEARAREYAGYFKNFTIDGQPLQLDSIFAAQDSSHSHRPRLTVEPTAKALGLTIDSRYANNQFQELANEIESRPHGKSILICWHHGRIPQLLHALGADPQNLLPNGKWPDDVFGWVILLRYNENGKLFESKRISENLSSRDLGEAMPVEAREQGSNSVTFGRDGEHDVTALWA